MWSEIIEWMTTPIITIKLKYVIQIICFFIVLYIFREKKLKEMIIYIMLFYIGVLLSNIGVF